MKVEGLYNPALRFAFTNITKEDFSSTWNGSPLVVKPGQTIELPHHLAVKLTTELVDKIMIGAAKLDEIAVNQPYYRSPKGGSLGVPSARKVWEDQILRELSVDEESPEIQVIRAEERAKLLSDLEQSNKPVEPVLSNVKLDITEFSELKDANSKKEEVVKKPLKVKTIKIKE